MDALSNYITRAKKKKKNKREEMRKCKICKKAKRREKVKDCWNECIVLLQEPATRQKCLKTDSNNFKERSTKRFVLTLRRI